MRVIAPPSGNTVAGAAGADAPAVADALQRARRAQPAWATTPLEVRRDAVLRFRALVVERTEGLAETLTREVGKPITQSRGELAGLLGRIDFFLDEGDRPVADRVGLASA